MVTVIKPSTWSDLLHNPNVNSQLEVYNLANTDKHKTKILIFRDSLAALIFLELQIIFSPSYFNFLFSYFKKLSVCDFLSTFYKDYNRKHKAIYSTTALRTGIFLSYLHP